jgi:hypothetical protein
MKDRITYDEPVSDEQVEDWSDDAAQLEVENKALREALNDLHDQGMIAQPYYASQHELTNRIDALLTADAN